MSGNAGAFLFPDDSLSQQRETVADNLSPAAPELNRHLVELLNGLVAKGKLKFLVRREGGAWYRT